MLRIDLEDLDVLKDFNSIFIGAMAKQYARDSDIIGTSEYNWHFLFQPEIHQDSLDKLHVLMQRFPRVIIDMNVLESEFLDIQVSPDEVHTQ